ncbi:hypothetical protein [Mesorhizobium sp.]|uniref:hypothetical protein n=1 Tax=Mesorhizobium sp. TaxID=1871066 RepID=UPI000FE5B7BD|nr:hypothetical protein [Mesorhizobium sp.]RWO43350.1 MAG: hypothetical protein EOS13_30695 [Mesorhizobium sp.]TIN28093.1 MAG: hypothetical protein E5Y19_08795 [Mesorhizobium sp.]TIN33696.1 MAG: hypothetical protein E5Y13_31825 [Mesorhizobium sp.]TJU76989.1 MAG: hypothetical protein E5Y15_27600 [Mesorhizobium sp.]TJU84252.1 MAG: hypothetical protein E5Y10_30995 [Mesorhizobium sp.]
MNTPILKEIVRQHAEMAAFLWTVYDYHLLHPDENPDMDEERVERLLERLEAHLDGLRVAGEDGRTIAREQYEQFPEGGELFVCRMLATDRRIAIAELKLDNVRRYLTANSVKPL